MLAIWCKTRIRTHKGGRHLRAVGSADMSSFLGQHVPLRLLGPLPALGAETAGLPEDSASVGQRLEFRSWHLGVRVQGGGKRLGRLGGASVPEAGGLHHRHPREDPGLVPLGPAPRAARSTRPRSRWRRSTSSACTSGCGPSA